MREETVGQYTLGFIESDSIFHISDGRWTYACGETVVARGIGYPLVPAGTVGIVVTIRRPNEDGHTSDVLGVEFQGGIGFCWMKFHAEAELVTRALPWAHFVIRTA